MKPVPKIICALLLAGAVAGAFLERNALSKVRADNRQLREQSAEAQRLARENATLDHLRDENQEIQMLRNQTAELHKLRNEVRQLREQKPELDKVRAENRRLRVGAGAPGGPAAGASKAGPLVAKEMLADAGLGSPEAAIQTFFWAAREGNAQRFRACFADQIRDESDETILNNTTHMMDKLKAFQIVAKKAVSADEIKLGIRITTPDASTPEEMALPFKRVGSEWKLIGIGL